MYTLDVLPPPKKSSLSLPVRPPLNDIFENENQLAILMIWKVTKEINTHNFCLENKVTTDDYGRIPSKYHKKLKPNLNKTIAFVR